MKYWRFDYDNEYYGGGVGVFKGWKREIDHNKEDGSNKVSIFDVWDEETEKELTWSKNDYKSSKKRLHDTTATSKDNYVCGTSQSANCNTKTRKLISIVDFLQH